MKKKELACHICGKKKPAVELIPTSALRVGVLNQILKDYPDWKQDYMICSDHLNHYRSEYVRSLLEQEKGEVEQLEEEVLKSLQDQELLSTNIEQSFEEGLSFGERVSDKMASFGGSWPFIFIFFIVIVVWMVVNTMILSSRSFDPYPFILLNLVLSCLAAIQAPIIMMSQNRQEDRDRRRGINDYQVNLKAELEIRQLHQKIDHLISHQWERLAEIQEIQVELMNELKGTHN